MTEGKNHAERLEEVERLQVRECGKSDTELLQGLMNGLADSVLDLSEEEVLAEEREAGGDPVREAARVRGLFSPIRVLIADDHEIFRDGLRRLLEVESDISVVGEASDGTEVVRLVRQLNPDILLLDLIMPKRPGLEALRELSGGAQRNATRVLLLTAGADKSQIVEALQLGARGVVLKDSATSLLLNAMHTVMAGEYWVGRRSVPNLVRYLRDLMQSSQNDARHRRYGLTARELEVVSAVVDGYSNREIAGHFKISEDTVKHHMSNIFDKVGVSTRLELALFAVNHSVPLPGIA